MPTDQSAETTDEPIRTHTRVPADDTEEESDLIPRTRAA